MGNTVLLVTSEFPPGPGGIGSHAHQLARELTGLGWTMTVATPQQYVSAGESADFNAEQPFRVVSLGSRPRELARPIPGYQLLRRALDPNPDAIIASGRRPVWLTSVIATARRIPWMAVGHGSEFVPSARWRDAMSRWAFGRASTVVCVSNHTRSKMMQLGIRPRADAVIPNGGNPDAFNEATTSEREQWRNDFGVAGRAVILTVGNVTERKGQETIIRALPLIAEQHSDVTYLMAGLPTDEPRLAALARELGVASKTRFLGRVSGEDLRRLFNIADVFAMTSIHTATDFEGFGIAVVEAALCGAPAVVSRDSGLAEAISDGVTGVGVPERDFRATATAIGALLADDDRRVAMGAAARDRALATQTWTHRAAQYDDVLRDLVG